MFTIQPPTPRLPMLRRAFCALLLVCLLLASYFFLPLSASAQAPTTLSGRVTNVEGEPLTGSILTLHRFVEATPTSPSSWEQIFVDVQTDGNGEYAFTRLTAGLYRLQTSGVFQAGKLYIGEFYDNQSSLESATDIVVAEGATLTGYDFILSRNGVVMGTVVDAEGNPLEGIQVENWRDFGSGPAPHGSVVSDAAGRFTLSFEPETVNWLSFFDYSGRYLAEFYDNKNDIATADALSAGINETITLTVALSRTKTISGTVTDTQGEPVRHATITLYQQSMEPNDWFQGSTVTTDDEGGYRFENLLKGKYRLEFSSATFVQEYYSDQSSFEDATILDLNSSPEVVIADAEVTRLGVLTGTVSDTDAAPLEGVGVSLYDQHGNQWFGNEVFTDENGNYQIDFAPPNQEFRIKFRTNGQYVDEYYDNAFTLEAAQPISVPLEATIPNINAELDRYGLITGTVTNDLGVPIQYVYVQPYWDIEGTDTWTAPDEYPLGTMTDESGSYQARLLPGHDFRIGFSHLSHEAEFFDNQPTVATATNISVSLNAVVPNINAELVAGPVISGTIMGYNGALLEGVLVEVLRFDESFGSWSTVASMYSDAAGKYALGLLAGTYRLAFHSPNADYTSEYYADAATVEAAEDIVLANGQNRTIDAQLAVIPGISGRVTTSNGTLEFFGEVFLRKRVVVDGKPEWECCTYFTLVNGFSGGLYRFQDIEPGEYLVEFKASSDFYQTEYYPNQRTPERATILTVTAESYFTGIDAELEELGAIAGTVVNANNQPLSGILITLMDEAMFTGKEASHTTTTTDAQGKFRLRVDEAPRWLQFDDPFFSYYASEFHDDQPNVANADAITVASGSALTLTVVLSRSVAITGQVTNLPGQPVENAAISVFTYWPQRPEPWQPLPYTYGTDAAGNYRINGLSPHARYRLQFEKDGVIRYYPDAATIEDAEDVVITSGPSLPDVNMVLSHPEEVKAIFSGAPLTGTGSLTVTFSDHSLGPVSSRAWDFGDGSLSSEISPTHTYTAAGIYTVTLTVTGTVNSDSEKKVGYVSLVDSPISQLEVQQGNGGGNPGTQPVVGQTIYFSATAAGSNIQYLWDFGDETLAIATTAIGQYVQHSYDAAGTYTVTLTASNGAGAQVATMPITVTSGKSPIGALTLHGPSRAPVNHSVTFSATVGAGDNVTYTWDFGDGETDEGESGTGQEVTHTYREAGTYTVTLTASNSEGQSQVTHPITIDHTVLLPRLGR